MIKSNVNDHLILVKILILIVSCFKKYESRVFCYKNKQFLRVVIRCSCPSKASVLLFNKSTTWFQTLSFFFLHICTFCYQSPRVQEMFVLLLLNENSLFLKYLVKYKINFNSIKVFDLHFWYIFLGCFDFFLCSNNLWFVFRNC